MKKNKPQPAPPAPVTTPSAVQTQALGLSEEERQGRQAQIGQANAQVGESNRVLSSMEPSLGRFTQHDATGYTPFQRALRNTKSSEVANTGDQALSRIRQRQQAAGYGFAQPMSIGSEAAHAEQQAQRIGNIGSEVELESLQPEMQALSLQNDIAGQYRANASPLLSGAGLYTPTSYFGEGVGLERQRQENINEANSLYSQEQEAARRRKGGLLGGLAKIGLGAASAIPGVGTGLGVIRGAAGGLR